MVYHSYWHQQGAEVTSLCPACHTPVTWAPSGYRCPTHGYLASTVIGYTRPECPFPHLHG